MTVEELEILKTEYHFAKAAWREANWKAEKIYQQMKNLEEQIADAEYDLLRGRMANA